MKIELRNFGPIDSLQFDLAKDLHLIYGQNAIGKSYATYCLYCLLKNIKNSSNIPRYYRTRDLDLNKLETKFLSKIKNYKNKTSNITHDVKQIIEDTLRDLLVKGFENSLLNTFSSLKNLKNRFSNKNYEIILYINDQEKISFFSDDEGLLELDYDSNIDKYEIRIKETKSTKYSLYKNNKMQFGSSNEIDFTKEIFNYCYMRFNVVIRKINSNIRDIYFLPASRSGLYQALNAFTPIIAELTQNRFFMQNKNIELPSLSEPLADYFIDLSTVDKKKTNKEFSSVVDALQAEILKGEVDYNEKTKRIMYKPNDIDLELNLSEASSMVSELSPLVLYFKHILNNKFSSSKNKSSIFSRFYDISRSDTEDRIKSYDVLFIEEPEAHLHPEVQVKLMKIFSKLSSLGLKVFITSHSNYMFNKLNNMIIDKEIDSNKTMVYHLIGGSNGTIKNENMNVSNEGINDFNFSETAEKLYFERMQILDKQND